MKAFILLFALSINALPNLKRHIVLNDGVRLRSKPEISVSNVIGSVNTTEEVELLEISQIGNNTWAYIKTETNQKGWILKNFIGVRGDRKISEFLKNNLNMKLKELEISDTDEIVKRILSFEGDKEKILDFAKKHSISQEMIGFILLSQRNKKGVSFIINTIKNKSDKSLLFTLQTIASENIVKNDYVSFNKWYRENFETLILDDFALVRAFSRLH